MDNKRVCNVRQYVSLFYIYSRGYIHYIIYF